METLSGSIERVTYYNPENGYSVVRLRPDRRRRAFPAHGVNREGLITIVGNLPELTPGEFVELEGDYTNHPKHGYQFQVEVCRQTLPATTDAIRRYLGSGLIKGIGPAMADRIVGHFGDQTLAVIENTPQQLKEVPDIGPKRTRMIAAAWSEQKQIKDIMLFLHGHGISTNLAVKIYKTYDAQALEIVQRDPYQLARDIYGVGFKTADKIARTLGLEADHPSRLEAGLVYTLNQRTDDGHVYTPRETLVREAAALLEVDESLIPAALERLAQAERIIAEQVPVKGSGPEGASGMGVAEARPAYDPESTSPEAGEAAIYLAPLYYGEVGVARRLAGLAGALPSRLSDIPPTFTELSGHLTEAQAAAIRTALSHPVSVLTGGPGTGKTTCLQSLISVAESHNKRYALASPTGRAAKRLAEATGRPASTIHRLLDYSPRRGFVFNDENPLPIDLLIVDEVSMLDLVLANSLLKALAPGTHLLLVGDVDQLPSVGAGDVLRDVIASRIAPVTRLETIFRQAADSHIIANAHRVNRGEYPQFPGPAGEDPAGSPDFYLFPAEDAPAAGDWVVDVVTNRVPERFGFDPRLDIQVLAPMYRGPAGVRALNDRLQDALNPAAALKPQKTLYGQTYRPGDKVMQTQNDYDKEVFNGDIGQVLSIQALDHTMTIEFDGRPVVFDWTDCDQITLAYCVSVHKSQGAEFPVVVLPLVTQHFMMLQRNLLYTAVTRAKKLCVLVGSRKAIRIAIKNNQVAARNTALDWRLAEAIRPV